MVRATREEVEQFLARMGQRGEKALSTLGKLQPFVDCMESEMGFTLLNGLVNRYEELLNKIAELKVTDEEKVEYKVTRDLLIDFSARISQYNEYIRKIKEVPKREK